jgi:hypothetical protein
MQNAGGKAFLRAEARILRGSFAAQQLAENAKSKNDRLSAAEAALI